MIDAVVLVKWVQDPVSGRWGPAIVYEIGAWALANGELLPGTAFGHIYEDVTYQAAPALRAIKAYAAKLRVTEATAAHFQDDSRLFLLGYRRVNAEGEVVASNWGEILDAESRTRAVNYLVNQGYTLAQITSRFSESDTRREIAEKLKTLFGE